MTPIWRRRADLEPTIAPAGAAPDTLPGGKRLFLPLRTGSGPVGVIASTVMRRTVLTPDEKAAARRAVRPGAVAIERISLAKGLDEARVLPRRAAARALLTSILARSGDAARLDLGAVSACAASGEVRRGRTRGAAL